MQRARKFATLFAERFRVRTRPVVVYDDDQGRYSYQQFDGEVLLLSMRQLRSRTQGLSFRGLEDVPGLASDRTLAQLALLRQFVKVDPKVHGWYGGPLALANEIARDVSDLHLPLVGHQDAGALPDTLDTWLAKARESDDHLATRIDGYLDELHVNGLLEGRTPQPRLSMKGGHVVLRLLRTEREDAR